MSAAAPAAVEAPVTLRQSPDSASENWTLDSDGAIVGGPSGDCLQVAGGSTADYAGVDIYTCNGSGSESWSQQP
jgi:hypothetical protein